MNAMYTIPHCIIGLCHVPDCPLHSIGIDIEPGLNLLKEEFKSGKILRLDEQTRNRLEEFAKDGETFPQLINRLLKIATEKTASTTEAAAENRICPTN